MATSGTNTLAATAIMIASALRKINAFESGETPDSQSVSDASDALNAMVKHWQGSGIRNLAHHGSRSCFRRSIRSAIRWEALQPTAQHRKLCRDRADLCGGARGIEPSFWTP
jgi:hypothetical protein